VNDSGRGAEEKEKAGRDGKKPRETGRSLKKALEVN